MNHIRHFFRAVVVFRGAERHPINPLGESRRDRRQSARRSGQPAVPTVAVFHLPPATSGYQLGTVRPRKRRPGLGARRRSSRSTTSPRKWWRSTSATRPRSPGGFRCQLTAIRLCTRGLAARAGTTSLTHMPAALVKNWIGLFFSCAMNNSLVTRARNDLPVPQLTGDAFDPDRRGHRNRPRRCSKHGPGRQRHRVRDHPKKEIHWPRLQNLCGPLGALEPHRDTRIRQSWRRGSRRHAATVGSHLVCSTKCVSPFTYLTTSCSRRIILRLVRIRR